LTLQRVPANVRPLENRETIVAKAAKSGARKMQALQLPLLDTLCKEKTPVTMHLVNGTRLDGRVAGHDDYMVLLQNTETRVVYKHMIATIAFESEVKKKRVAKHPPAMPVAADPEPAVPPPAKPAPAKPQVTWRRSRTLERP